MSEIMICVECGKKNPRCKECNKRFRNANFISCYEYGLHFCDYTCFKDYYDKNPKKMRKLGIKMSRKY